MKIIKDNLKCIVVAVIGILLLTIVLLIVSLIYVITKDDDNSKNKNEPVPTPTLQVSPTVEATNSPTTEPTSEPTDPGDLWSIYTNSTYNISLKYPIDLDYEESSIDSNTFQVMFKSGNTTVFRIWIKNNGDLDSLLSNMLANQCTQTIQYTNVTYGYNTYRKALDVPNQSCLDSLGITRDIELAAYGKVLEPNIYFAILNEGLNAEQLDILLKKADFE